MRTRGIWEALEQGVSDHVRLEARRRLGRGWKSVAPRLVGGEAAPSAEQVDTCLGFINL